MSAQYTPSTEEVEKYYSLPWQYVNRGPAEIEEQASSRSDEFRRWHAAEIRNVKAQAWDEGRSAEQEYRCRQDDADAAGMYVQIDYPRNPYRSKPSCGCDLSGMTPPAAHLVDDHEGTGDER